MRVSSARLPPGGKPGEALDFILTALGYADDTYGVAVYACEPWVFAMCPALRGSTVSYAGDAHFAKHSLEYSLNFWSQPKKKR